MVRIAKIGRMYKLIKLTKLIRIVKIMKQKNRMVKYAATLFNIGKGIERISFFIVASVMVCHIFACLWIFFSSFSNADESTWMSKEIKAMSMSDQYLTSFYFTITTFSTVGYGDISASSKIEKIVCIIIMCIGVTAFAAGTSFITNLLSSYDQENAKLQ